MSVVVFDSLGKANLPLLACFLLKFGGLRAKNGPRHVFAPKQYRRGIRLFLLGWEVCLAFPHENAK